MQYVRRVKILHGNMAATITRYNFAKSLNGTYFPIDDSGVCRLAWIIGDTLANLMLSRECPIQQIRMLIGSDYITVVRQPWRVSVFIADAPYSRRIHG